LPCELKQGMDLLLLLRIDEYAVIAIILLVFSVLSCKCSLGMFSGQSRRFISFVGSAVGGSDSSFVAGDQSLQIFADPLDGGEKVLAHLSL
jgi:hypothetical protein